VALGRPPRIDPRVERILTSDRVAGYVADVLPPPGGSLLEPEMADAARHFERDVVTAPGMLASQGWASALTDLHANLSWRQCRSS